MSYDIFVDIRRCVDEAEAAAPETHNARCSPHGVQDNIRHFLKYGRSGQPVSHDQAKAIAMSLLRKGCGAPRKKVQGTKKILSYGEAREADVLANKADTHARMADHHEREIGRHPKGSHKRYQVLAQSLFHRREHWKHAERAHQAETDPGLKKAHETNAQSAYAKMKMLHPHVQAAHAAQKTRWVG